MLIILAIYAGYVYSVGWLSFNWETAFYLDSFPWAVYGVMLFVIMHVVFFCEIGRRGYIVKPTKTDH